MPHLETLFRGNSCSRDNRIICETALISADDLPQVDPDLPADSFCLPIEDEVEWVDRNALFERKKSTKGNSIWTNWNPISYYSQSKRITSNLKPSTKPSIIIGLPKRHDNAQICRRSCRPASIRDIVKSSGTGLFTEPASPKVSCVGRVRQKDKVKGCRQGGSTENLSPAVKAAKVKLRVWDKLLSAFRHRRRGQRERAEEKATNESSQVAKATPEGTRKTPAAEVADAPAPSLCELKKFQSLRRSASWVADVEVDSDAPAEKESTKRPFWCRRR